MSSPKPLQVSGDNLKSELEGLLRRWGNVPNDAEIFNLSLDGILLKGEKLHELTWQTNNHKEVKVINHNGS